MKPTIKNGIYFLAVFITLESCLNNDEKAPEKQQVTVQQTDADETATSTNVFNIDTVSYVSPASVLLEEEARELQLKLINVLPKISITSGSGDNKFTRKFYLVEGDLKLDRDELFYYCLKRLQTADTNVTERKNSQKLTVASDKNGKAAIWKPGSTLSYCIKRSTFESKAHYDSVVASMKVASQNWAEACNIKFEYLADLDKTDVEIEDVTDKIFFIVRNFTANGEFIAQAFFPSDAPYMRHVLLDPTFFSSGFSKTGILRHELGHVLGFRHEHIWSREADCKGEEIIEGALSAKPVTIYDPYSVMHYPCGPNRENRIITLTDFDKAGARKVYPF